jgi:ABC-type cobalt transport system, ATPase component
LFVVGDIEIERGERVALLGRSGSGKTTLIRAAICLRDSPKPFLDGRDFCADPDYSKVSAVMQEPSWQVLAETSEEELSLISRYHDSNISLARELMGPYFSTPFMKLSDGYKRRFVLSSVLVGGPEYLLLDEPFSNLDSEGVKLVSDALPHTYLMAEHRVPELRSMVDRVYVISSGVREVNKDKLWDEDFLRSHGLRGFKIWRERRRLGETILRADIKGISVEVRRGEVLCLVGSNGSGKTTAIKQLSKRGVRAVFQNPDLQFFVKTVGEEVNSSEALSLFNLVHLKDRSPYTLSYGEKMRVLMASAIASGSKVVAFDEPSTGMDGDSLISFVRALELLSEDGRGIVIATHDRDVVEVCDSVVKLG